MINATPGPVYVERRKSDQSLYETKTPAKIMYCGGDDGWVFLHPDIRKSKDSAEVRNYWQSLNS